MHNQKIQVFDQLQYQHNIRGQCPYVLAQEHRRDKQSRIQVWLETKLVVVNDVDGSSNTPNLSIQQNLGHLAVKTL